MQKKIIVLLLTTAISLVLVSGSWAMTKSISECFENAKSERVLTSGEIRVSFQDDTVRFGTQELIDVLDCFGTSITQIVFKVPVGDQTITIGFFAGKEDFLYIDMYDKVLEHIESLNADDMRAIIPDYENIDISELYLYQLYYDDSFRNENSNTSETACSVADLYYSASIGGSYHYYDFINDQYVLRWHNGISGINTVCLPTISEPHAGDGNTRYYGSSSFKWFPRYVYTQFGVVSNTTNYTRLSYIYDSSHLNNFVVDTNEALEMEILFYNYCGAGVSASEKGSTFQLRSYGETWSSNQPTAYLDTTICDNSSETVSMCVGVEDASDMVANTAYYWQINGTAGTQNNSYPYDGKYRVMSQRSYKYILSGAYGVFCEEHEPIRRLGVPTGHNWNTDYTAWEQASGGIMWMYDTNSSLNYIQ